MIKIKEKLNNLDYNTIFNDFIIVYPLFLMIYTSFALNYLNILLIGLFILKVKKDGLKISFLEKYIIIFLFGLIISFINTPFCMNKGVSEIIDILQWIFFPLIIGQFTLKEKTKKYLIFFLIIGLIVYSVRFYFHIDGIIKLPLYSGSRYSGGYMISQVSLVLASFFMFFSILFFYGKLSRREKTLIVISIILTLLLLLITKTRGIYLAVLITIPLILLLRNLEYFFISVLLGSIMIVVLVFSFPNNKFVLRLKNITQADVSTLGRLEVWQESIRIFKKNPVNGVGYMNFKKVQNLEHYKYNKYYAHSHSMIFKLLCETGLIGLFGYLLLNLKLIFRSIKTEVPALNMRNSF